MNTVVFLNQSGDFVNVLGMIGIALLTILLPVAVAIFGDSKDFEVLDRNVILDHVVSAQLFMTYLTLVFLPLFLWGGLSTPLRFWGLISWGAGIYLIAKVLIDSYHWMKGNKFLLRFEYLKKLNNLKDMEESWRSVWQTKNINAQNEKEFFIIFSSAIDNLLKK